MATLTEAAIFSKKFFVWIVVFVVVLSVFLILVMIGGSLKEAFFPPKAPPATVAFGKISDLDLSGGVRPPDQIDYFVETISGDLPSFEEKLKVFKIKSKELSFGDLERAKILLAKFGFTQEPKNLGGNNFEFEDFENGTRNLTLNVVSGNFKYSTDFVNDESIALERPTNVKEAIEKASSFLTSFGISEAEFPIEKVETLYLKIEDKELAEVPAISLANLIQVNFIRADIDRISVFNPQLNKPLVFAVVSKNGVVAAEVSKLAIDKHRFATYPLKGTVKAFEDLQNGKGAFNKKFSSSRFPIRNVELAYLESRENQGYLMPVYVFRSDGGFFAYVSAIDDLWLIKEPR